MDFEEVVLIYKKYVEPFIAFFVLLGLIYAGVMLYENYQAKKNIAAECGWVEEDVRCTCERSAVIAAENQMRGMMPEVPFDVEVDK